MINISLSTGQFPAPWQVALVKLLLKKSGIGAEFSNVRPISNLQYISKLVEGAAIYPTNPWTPRFSVILAIRYYHLSLLYADDTQVYLSFCPNTPNEDYCIIVLETCIEYIRAWMLQNKLMLNDRKTELLLVLHVRYLSSSQMVHQ